MKRFFGSGSGKLSSLMVLLAVIALTLNSCSDLINEPSVLDQTVKQDQGALTKDNPEIRLLFPFRKDTLRI